MPLLLDDALVKNPLLRRDPTSGRGWRIWLQELNKQNVRFNKQSFTPTWTGFSADPTGDFNYINFGTHCLIWNTAAMSGTSDANSMAIAGVPSEIQSVNVQKAYVLAIEGSNFPLTNAQLDSSGNIGFDKMQVSGSDVIFSSNAWATSGAKGLSAGSVMLFALD